MLIVGLGCSGKGRVWNGRIYTPVTGYAGRTAPFSIQVILSDIWRLHVAKAAFRGWLCIARNSVALRATDHWPN
ncbi:hypothetical protein B9D02_22170 (plasmid) [Pantoea vagans]|nr:hypothetical protein B9D02_22170 [Pantoea vagans]